MTGRVRRHGFADMAVVTMVAAAVLLLPRSIQAQAVKPQRIVSVNLCTDQLLVDLVPRARIAAVTNLATDPLSTPVPERAQGIAETDGSVESVLAYDPDLVLVTPFTSPATVSLLKRVGRRVEVIPLAQDFAGIRTAIMAVARATGELAAGEALIEKFNSTLALAAQKAAERSDKFPSAVVYQVNNYVSGAAGIVAEALERAGFRNHAITLGARFGGQVPLESIVVRPPDLLVMASGPKDYATTVADNLRHPVLAHLAPRMASLVVPWSLWLCGTHHIGRAVELLAEMRSYVVARGRP